jgi:hypothetical protein
MGTPVIAGWIAHVAFWTLLIVGAWSDDLGPRAIAVFLILWLVGMFGLPQVSFGAGLSTPFVAVLDIALVFMVFKSDIRLT